jgi:hypothetical protein
MIDGVQGIDPCGDYAAPVCQLLRIGEPGGGYDPAEWPDYSAEFGIGHEHVGALIGIACDSALHHGDPNSSAVWAPVHAWRALGQLRAEASVEPLLALLKALEYDDAVDLEVPCQRAVVLDLAERASNLFTQAGQVTQTAGGSAHSERVPGSVEQSANRQCGVTAWYTGLPVDIRPALRSGTNIRSATIRAFRGISKTSITLVPEN